MKKRVNKFYYPLLMGLIGLLVIAGCQSNSSDVNNNSSKSSSENNTSLNNSKQETSKDTENGDYKPAEWAQTPITTSNEKLTTIKSDQFKVDIYQISVEKATKKGVFVNPGNNKPIIDIGDDIVFVNYVVTNISNKSIKLGASLVDIEAKYEDWPYIQGMDRITDFNLEEKLKLSNSGTKSGSFSDSYVLKPGTSYSISDNFKYQKGGKIEFKATLIPVNDQGKLQFDSKKEASSNSIIQ